MVSSYRYTNLYSTEKPDSISQAFLVIIIYKSNVITSYSIHYTKLYDETSYEIYDEFGGIVFKGYGKEVKIGTLNKGKYYLNYDNQMDRFTKK